MGIGIIDGLQLIEVKDPGVPNLERVAIYVEYACELSEYCLLLGMPLPDGSVNPLRDHMHWFGHGFVNPGDWIFVYTATGTTTVEPNGRRSGSSIQPRIINLHWGKDHTVFQNRGVVPMLIKIEAVGQLKTPTAAYQGGANRFQPTTF